MVRAAGLPCSPGCARAAVFAAASEPVEPRRGYATINAESSCDTSEVAGGGLQLDSRTSWPPLEPRSRVPNQARTEKKATP